MTADTAIRRHLSKRSITMSARKSRGYMKKLWIVCIFVPLTLFAQARGQRGAPQVAKSVAPVDFTGYWVSVVSEDWRHRMTTPRKGDYESLPLNTEGRRVADMWDLAKDNQAGVQCKPFGIGGIMREPGRLHITWQDDNTL